MTSKTAIIWTCGHDRPEVSKERYEWLGKLIEDIKPDYTVDLGDGAEMASLNSFDKVNPKAIVAQSYEADVESYNKSQDILWGRFRKSKKKRPYRIGFEGNHEHRITTAIKFDPRLEGSKGGRFGISMSHLQHDKWFDDYHYYDKSEPAIAEYDGVKYAHWMKPNNGRQPMGGDNHARNLATKMGASCTVGHSHFRNIAFLDGTGYGKGHIGLVAGCFKGSDEQWAGQSNKLWAKGVVIKRNICDGMYDPEWVSMDALRKEYG